MTKLTELTLAQVRNFLKNKEFTAVELTNSYLKEIEESNPKLNAYIAVSLEKALKMASDSDVRLMKNEGRNLEGVPLGIKDIFATKGLHTQACSNILKGFIPAYESTVTENLWKDGAVCLGKLNMDEFAMGSSNETSCYGPVQNPWRAEGSDIALSPGGSSGGSSAAVAAHLCVAATATDTGGSIREPAAFTATVGIKPTYGRCSRWGVIAFASSLDQAGPIARDVRDCAIMLQSMASYDPKDSTSVDVAVPNYESYLGQSIKGFKIGIPTAFRENLSPEIDSCWEKLIQCLKSFGAEIVHIDLPHSKHALPAYYIIAPAEASSNLSRYDGVRYGLRVPGDTINDLYEKTRQKGFGCEVKRRIIIGTYVLSVGHYESYYLKAQKIRTLIKQDFTNAFSLGVDAILTPSAPSPAFPIGKTDFHTDSVSMYLNDIFTVTVNMAGLPAISMPAGLSKEGLPLGMQFIGKPFEEGKLLQLSYILEQSIGSFFPKRWW